MEFNSEEYSWKDISIIWLGRIVIRILEIKYKAKQELKPIYGRGSKPLALQSGNESYEGEIKLGQSEIEAAILKAQEIDPNYNVLHLPSTNITICYEKNGIVITDVCKGIKFKELEKALKQGDLDMEITLPWEGLDIEYNTLS